MNNVNSAAQPLPSAKTSGLAIASLISGIFALWLNSLILGIFALWLNLFILPGPLVTILIYLTHFCTLGLTATAVTIFAFITVALTSVLGLILGIRARNDIKKRAEQLKGKGLAIAGIVVSVISLSLVLIAPIPISRAILFDRARTKARTLLSLNYAKQICMTMAMYCDENDGRFPPAENWPDVLKPYIGDEKMLTSPFAPEAGRAWAMNAHLEGWKLSDIKQPYRVVLVFESRFNSPPAGGLELLPEGTQERKCYIIGFVDGHIECVRPERLDELIWAPELQPYLEVK